MMTPSPTTYLLRRDRSEAVRLDAQHLLWQLHTKYLLHPEIPRKDGMIIADIGAGTGIWALELAPNLPPDARLVAYDIADTHFPAKEYWPANVRFELLDSLSPTIPEALIGQFDVVHLRMWAFIIRDNDPSALIRHASRLLKPGGYLQWEDARFGSIVQRGLPAQRFRELMNRQTVVTGHDFRWLDNLAHHIQTTVLDDKAETLKVVECRQQTPWATPQLIPLATDTFMLALENSSAVLDKLRAVAPSVPTQEEWLAGLAALHEDVMRKQPRDEEEERGEFHWLPVCLLGRKMRH
ncbi:class I SAM-dependent methyltransferase [Aspergillus aculeatinus CBS 121060]|uniref:S-adenosyl-L-methionine-dependent methyltransferase n=1 Tax=Aspergillus aculeatinus CBS 121060 TaxID=1448322 RepID=A0ACD1H1C9_9EURO|nr:S-adenosyl-L-methionine-dependent methyltransferase [Aspergillus aculeatinus CBS 121060]RAH67562.1 S-adenosyl-L-methionine-dependent methyltransferase [Aspergillus aculeatinus CBS 121060]